MTELTCDMCMDLFPLVRDGIASADSEAAVRNHLDHCPQCRAAFAGELPETDDARQGCRKLRRHIRFMVLFLLLFGVCFGLSLSGGGEMFYNVWIMPVLGALGYGLFREKALWSVPLLVVLTHAVMYGLGLVWTGEPWQSQLFWSICYSLFAVTGTVIAGLLHFALKKED